MIKRRETFDSAHVGYPVRSIRIVGEEQVWYTVQVGAATIWIFAPEQAQELAAEFARVARALRDEAAQGGES